MAPLPHVACRNTHRAPALDCIARALLLRRAAHWLLKKVLKKFCGAY